MTSGQWRLSQAEWALAGRELLCSFTARSAMRPPREMADQAADRLTTLVLAELDGLPAVSRCRNVAAQLAHAEHAAAAARDELAALEGRANLLRLDPPPSGLARALRDLAAEREPVARRLAEAERDAAVLREALPGPHDAALGAIEALARERWRAIHDELYARLQAHWAAIEAALNEHLGPIQALNGAIREGGLAQSRALRAARALAARGETGTDPGPARDQAERAEPAASH